VSTAHNYIRDVTTAECRGRAALTDDDDNDRSFVQAFGVLVVSAVRPSVNHACIVHTTAAAAAACLITAAADCCLLTAAVTVRLH